MKILLLIVLGLIAGIAGGLLGIGGGALVVPGLVFLLNFNQHRAHGTSLAAVLAMSTAGTLTYWHHGHIDWLLTIEVAAGGMAGAMIGARIVGAIKSRTLQLMFCAFLALAGGRMIVAGLAQGANGVNTACIHYTLASVMFAVLIGVASGMLSAILGVGGGVVMVPAMVLLLCVPQKTAQGVSLAAIAPIAFTGMLAHRAMGNVDSRAAVWVGLGGLAGAVTGATAMSGLASSALKLAFGAFLIIMSAMLVLKRQNKCE